MKINGFCTYCMKRTRGSVDVCWEDGLIVGLRKEWMNRKLLIILPLLLKIFYSNPFISILRFLN